MGLLPRLPSRNHTKSDRGESLMTVHHKGEALMKRSAVVEEKASREKSVIVAVDVSLDRLNLYTEIANVIVEREFANRTDVVEQELGAVRERAREAGCSDVLVFCEPSGGCEQTLLNCARRLGLCTAWANAEAVSRLRTVENNEGSKTDRKDPRVIHLLGRLGKMQKHRVLQAPYCLLREWHGIYLAAEAGVVAAKDAIHPQLRQLFPDFSFKTEFLFGPSGRGLLKRFGFNPARIVRAGRRRFESAMRKEAPRIQKRSLERLWRDAELSARHDIDERLRMLWENRLGQLFADLDVHEQRKQEAGRALEKLYAEARAVDPQLPKSEPGVITTLHLARLVGETGPLSDFESSRQLLRFVGLNLRERQSGKYRGKTRLSKKGRSQARHVLGQCVLPLVARGRLFSDYFHRKRDDEGMSGAKAMTAVMRLFVKLIFGWYKSGRHFDRQRVFLCESQYREAA
jgi:transposase